MLEGLPQFVACHSVPHQGNRHPERSASDEAEKEHHAAETEFNRSRHRTPRRHETANQVDHGLDLASMIRSSFASMRSNCARI